MRTDALITSHRRARRLGVACSDLQNPLVPTCKTRRILESSKGVAMLLSPGVLDRDSVAKCGVALLEVYVPFGPPGATCEGVLLRAEAAQRTSWGRSARGPERRCRTISRKSFTTRQPSWLLRTVSNLPRRRGSLHRQPIVLR